MYRSPVGQQREAALRTVDEGFAWIESFTNLERGGYHPREYRLERMQELLRSFDEPHLNVPTVHLAGSKGKGSTAAFVSSGLKALGYRTGTYSSPHVSDYRERIRIDGAFADERILLAELRRIHHFVEPLRHQSDYLIRLPTTFELLTLLAFLVFRSAACDWIVLETGLGGRLDATNLCDPSLCIIAPIELEHTEYLGHTLAEIATEKAGILKPGVPAITAWQCDEVDHTLSLRASERGAPMERVADRIMLEDITIGRLGTQAALKELAPADAAAPPVTRKLELSMVGDTQAENAAVAYVSLRSMFPAADPDTILAGFSGTSIPGRAEYRAGSPSLLFDGAHTGESMRRFADTVASIAGSPRILIFGSVEGKPVEPMARALNGLFEHIIISRPGNFKPSDPAAIARVFSNFPAPVDLKPDPRAALTHATELAGADGTIVVTGSFYMVCEIQGVGRES